MRVWSLSWSLWCASAIAAIVPTLLTARELHVKGDLPCSKANGSKEDPYISITAAVQNAQAGDTIFVHPVEGGYRETVSFHGHKGGAAGNPITLDGQGSLLIGSDILPPNGWILDSASGVYQRSDIRHVRLFLLVDGEMIFVSKKEPENLQPGEWCLVDGVTHYKPLSGRNLKELVIEAAVRANGVQINGKTSHIIVKNFTAQHFWNDGYNIHGEGVGLEFHNCNARDMGDEGFSAHGEAETLLDGAIYVNCDNGIFNANTGGKSISRNVIVRKPRSLGFGFSPRDGRAEHILENAILIDCPTALRVGEISSVTNAIILADGLERSTAISMDSGSHLRRVAISGKAVTPLRCVGDGPFRFSKVAINAAEPIYLRSTKAPNEVALFESSAFANNNRIVDGSFAVVFFGGTEKSNSGFEPVSSREFLELLKSGRILGPPSEMVTRAILELERP